ncbi:MAG: hypothetical protein Fur0010_02230 [Bdellovibrio sp.]
MYLKSLLVFFLCATSISHSAEICSRTAEIGGQTILIDSSSTQKGDGLRPYLEKDDVAKTYLDTYQDNLKIRWQNAILGTLGTGVTIAGILTNDNSNNRQTLLVGGLTLIAVNYLVARTLETSNEKNLLTAVEEYNRRNFPKIFLFKSSGDDKKGQGLLINQNWGF